MVLSISLPANGPTTRRWPCALQDRAWSNCGRFDLRDQIERYCRWAEEGYLSCTGHCFDIGRTVSAALRRYRETGDPMAGSTDPRSSGNGCIMRLAPVPMFFYPDERASIEHSAASSRSTHGTVECVEASGLLGGILVRALAGASKEDVLLGGKGQALRVRKRSRRLHEATTSSNMSRRYAAKVTSSRAWKPPWGPSRARLI